MRILFLFLIFSNLVFAKTKITIVGDNNYPPYSFKQNNQPAGIYADILKKAFAKMKDYQVTITVAPWKRALSEIKSAKKFAVYPPYHHTKKRAYIWPYSIPIIDEKLVVFCNSATISKRNISKFPDDFYGLTFGNNAGFSIGGDPFWHAVKRGKIKVKEFKSNEENLINLASNKIDCYMNDRISILYELLRLQRDKKFNTLVAAKNIKETITVSVEQGFLGLAAFDNGKYPFKEDFLKKFDTIIYQMRRTGELDNIVNEYISK